MLDENMTWLGGNSSTEFDQISSPLPGFSDADMNSSRENYDPNIIFYEHPEDMLNPSKRNPIFYHIIITHAVTFVVGILGNLVAVFVMIGDRKSRNATNLFLVRYAVIFITFQHPIKIIVDDKN